jgi:hypothetical protein
MNQKSFAYVFSTALLLLQAACDGDASTSSGNAPQSSSSQSTGGTQNTGGGGSGGTQSTGGGGQGGGQGGGELCAELTDGALIDFAITSETLRLWFTDDAFIDEALAQLNGQMDPRVPNFLVLVDAQQCDPQWTWHVDPAQVEFADFTIELCDGLPSHIEGDKTYWLETVKTYCPWTATVTAVDDRRQ